MSAINLIVTVTMGARGNHFWGGVDICEQLMIIPNVEIYIIDRFLWGLPAVYLRVRDNQSKQINHLKIMNLLSSCSGLDSEAQW